MKDQRNDFEDLCLSRLKALLPEGDFGKREGGINAEQPHASRIETFAARYLKAIIST